jgi:coenzyme F420-0:L-glutamate ligase / coenzyme F420-1:gamma-L-glutamate ligase
MAALPCLPAESAIDREGLARALRLIAQRHSVRRYTGQPLPADVIDALLHCASLAPSAHHRQPWRFMVLQGSAAKTRLGAAMGARLRRDRLADGDDPAVVEADVARSIERITDAPVVLLVASSLQDMDRYPDERRHACEAAMAMQSTAMAVQNLLLAASAAGLGACWMCAPLFCPDVVRAALGLPADWQPQGLVTLGVPAAAPKLRPRLALEDFVRKDDRA